MRLQPGYALDAREAPLEHTPVGDHQCVSGVPSTGAALLGELREVRLGIWEMTEGVMRDIEAEEIFVVLSGSGTVHFEDGHVVELRAGSVMRLSAGMRTIWTVREPLRKVFVA